ncbi:MAG: energy transducer TonB [Gammaproteobacteria bacterium]|nr:energy transducer TonB [Gammaproteobacteria bacterium]
MKKTNTQYWFAAVLIGTLINTSLFLLLPRLSYSDPPPPAPVIKLDFYAWQKPVAQKPPPKKAPPPKPKLKPKPKPKPPEPKKEIPKPVQKPVEKPVLSEKEVEPVKEPVEEIITSEPEPPQPPPPLVDTKEEEVDENTLPTPAPIFEVTSLPRFVHQVQPIYPPDMRAQGREAKVKVEALIDSKGVVRQVRIIKSAGEAFDEAALLAIKSSTFTPGDINGKPVAVLYRIPVTFKIR